MVLKIAIRVNIISLFFFFFQTKPTSYFFLSLNIKGFD